MYPLSMSKRKKLEKSPPPNDEKPVPLNSRAPRANMAMKQEPVPKISRRESELEELLADQERKKEADKVMLWRKLQAEIAKTSIFESE